MVRSDVPLSEKYRRILERYDEERRFGQDVEAYAGELQEGARRIPVSFLRVGRIALYVQSADRRISRSYDLGRKDWVDVPAKFRRDIAKAIDMARKQSPQDLLQLPIPRARWRSGPAGASQ